MDPATALGMAAAIVDLLELGIKVAKRLNEYATASPGDVPKPLENITTYLPLITKSLSQIKSETKLAQYDGDTRTILHGVVLGCLKLTQELDRLADKIVLKQGEGAGSKLKKVIQSLKYEDKIQEIDRGLQAYIQVLILHQVVNKKDVAIPVLEDRDYFEVKEVLHEDLIERPELMAKLHEGFSDVIYGLTQEPVTIVLQGVKGVGKSQLALKYCHKVRALKHFQIVFWLQSASPALLRLGLGNIASIVRQSSAGEVGEKLSFIDEFLADSYRPWLLVLDGYEHKAFDAEPLANILPDYGHGAVLVTTQSEDIVDLGTAVKMRKYLTPDDDKELRRSVTLAIQSLNMAGVVDALTTSLDVNSYSVSPWNSGSQPLINLAAERGFDDAVQLFLDMGADPRLDKRQLSALGCAVFHSHLSTVEVCLNHEDSAGYSLDEEAWTSITRYALSKGDTKILEVLLDRRGEKIKVSGHWPEEGFKEAAQHGHLEVLRLLLSRGKFPDSDEVRSTAVKAAIERQELDVVNFFLHEIRIDPNSLAEGWYSLLYVVCEASMHGCSPEDRNALIESLIKIGANPNIGKRSTKNTPLHLAAINKRVEAVQLLLKLGADATMENEDGDNALAWASTAANREETPLLALADAKIADSDARRKYFTDGLFIATRLGWRELALRMLEHADINALEKNSGDTPLVLAIQGNQLPLARMLVRKGADQSVAGKSGKIPLLLAAEHKMSTLVREMAKAKDSCGLEVSDAQGRTALMLAAKKGDEETVKMLLGLGADKDAMDKFGDTALDLAEEANCKKIVKLLEC